MCALFSGAYVITKPFLEFKQAVARYTNHIEHHYLSAVSRNTDENVAYKKELRYLFKNYGRFSVNALLSRLRSAHQEMVKQEVNKESETYQRYEQISSALLLVCSLIFFNELRGQILSALSEIDQLLVYWRYQYTHQISYFFSKSPLKWIIGKKQEQEIIHTILNLEHKQKELCILLGSLTEHVHLFNEVNTTYADCYTWVEKLIELCACIKTKSRYADGSRFDVVATQLELKLKKIDEFAHDSIASIKMAKKPGHFTRNWIRYAAGTAIFAYTLQYQKNNPEVVRSVLNVVQNETSKFFILLLHPLQKIYERGMRAVSTENKTENSEKKDKPEITSEDEIDPDAKKSMEELATELLEVGKETKSSIAKELNKSTVSFRDSGISSLRELLKRYPNSQMVLEFKNAGILEKIEKPVEAIIVDGAVINQKEVDEYQQALKEMADFVSKFSDSSWSLSELIKINIAAGKIRIDDDVLIVLEKYFDIIDNKIIRLFQLAAYIVAGFSKEAGQQLKDHELTLMFTSLIPLVLTGLGMHKAHKWATKRNYSPIRIALADVNSLLIESGNELDNHEYGKLLYLTYKLRDKTTQLKDALAHEFLWDIAKLESKQYSAQTKHDLIENMFHKYPFLGTIIL